jgi:hypothetical protein
MTHKEQFLNTLEKETGICKRLQLYLYIKMNGVELDTGDCWIQVEK